MERIHSENLYDSSAKSDDMINVDHINKTSLTKNNSEICQTPIDRKTSPKPSTKDIKFLNNGKKNIFELNLWLKSSKKQKSSYEVTFPIKKNLYKRNPSLKHKLLLKKDTTVRDKIPKMTTTNREQSNADQSYYAFLLEKSLNLKDKKKINHETKNKSSSLIRNNENSRSASSMNVTSPSSTYYSTRTENVHNYFIEKPTKKATYFNEKPKKNFKSNSINPLSSLHLSPKKVYLSNYNINKSSEAKNDNSSSEFNVQKEKETKKAKLSSMIKHVPVVKENLKSHKSVGHELYEGENNFNSQHITSNNQLKGLFANQSDFVNHDNSTPLENTVKLGKNTNFEYVQ